MVIEDHIQITGMAPSMRLKNKGKSDFRAVSSCQTKTKFHAFRKLSRFLTLVLPSLVFITVYQGGGYHPHELENETRDTCKLG